MSDEKMLDIIRIVSCVVALGLSVSVNAGWFEFGGNNDAIVEILQTTNISSKITAIGGHPKSVRIDRVSNDGSVVVGHFNYPKQTWDKTQIFRYTQSGGIENLGALDGKSVSHICVSADGLVIWGTIFIKNEGSHVFRYTQSNGFQDLGTMGQTIQDLGTMAPVYIGVGGVSSDGSVIIGNFRTKQSPSGSSPYHAFSYSQSKGFEDLGTMGADSAFALGISDDVSLIVGNIQLANTSSHAVRYSRSDGVVQDLGVGGLAAFATGVSNDGSVIVGKFFGEFSFINYKHYNHVFIYTKAGGVQKLGAMGGKDVGDPSISADGTKLVGSYMDSNGESYSYIAKIVLPEARK